MNSLRSIILFGNLAVFLVFLNWGIWTAEKNIEEGDVAYFELAPADPRSLFQGDYMRLDYAIERDAREGQDYIEFERKGQLVLRLDENLVAHYLRVYNGEELAEGEFLINYESPYSWTIDIGNSSFFFEEGTADTYATARYAEVRILDDNSVRMVALRDANLNLLGDRR